MSDIDQRYAMFTDNVCGQSGANKKICTVPWMARSIWTCGCPGRRWARRDDGRPVALPLALLVLWGACPRPPACTCSSLGWAAGR